MTAKKVSELTALTVPASEDLILIVDDPSGEPISKKITLGNLTKTVTSNLVSSNTLFANTIQANINFYVGTSTVNTSITSTSISVGNSSVNTQISPSGITANGTNITSVNAVTLGGNTATDLRSYSDAVSGTAYSNSITYSANASNILSGTLNTARLPATANVSTAINVGANVNLSTSAIYIGNSTVNTVISSEYVVTPSFVISNTTNTPANNSVGTAGEIRVTSSAIYVCIATNSWKKVDLSDFN